MAKTKFSTNSGTSSMEELLASTGYTFSGYKRGSSVKGKVKEVTNRTVFIDVGGKADAVVSEQEFALARDYFKALKPGDEVTGMVLVSENEAGHLVLSLRRAAVETRWKAFEQAMADETAVTVRGKEATKGGMLVDVDGVYGFVPSSQFGRDMEANQSTYIGKPFLVKVVEVDRSQNRLVLSERAVSESEELDKRKKALEQVNVGGEYEGTVVGTVPFGAFISVTVGKGDKAQTVEGLVHISEISWEKIDEVHKILKEGDKVQVQVIGVDEESGKLALSLKRLSSDPWIEVGKRFAIDSKHKGTVTKVVPYGVLVRLEKGVEGLIHASKLPANTAFKEGDDLEVFVESVDLDKRRLSLGVVLTEKPVGYK